MFRRFIKKLKMFMAIILIVFTLKTADIKNDYKMDILPRTAQIQKYDGNFMKSLDDQV